jgi:hypothetical protein
MASGLRQGSSSRDSARSNPLRRAVSTSNAPPVCDTSDSPPGGGRRPTSSVNVITAHDGFTLADLVSYDRKHNEANGEANGTAPTTTGRVTAVSRALPSTARSWPCAPARAGPCSPRCCCRSEFR